MSIITQNWLNRHSTRRYPLDDNATGLGDDGTKIKDDIIADLHLRWPAVAGQYAFLAGLTVTPTVVTAIFLACDASYTVGSFTPLAAVTIPQNVVSGRLYNLEALYPGVGGFIAFEDVSEAFTARFSTPAQGLLAPRVSRPYAVLPIPSLGKKGRVDALTGLITFVAGTDIEITKQTVQLDGSTVDAMVIGLARPTVPGQGILSSYIGPCGARPESNNCDRVGIETINGVAPDCDGNIEIAFPGMTVGPYASCGLNDAGTTLEQDTDLNEVCTPKSDPTRFRGQDLCSSSSSLSQSSESLSSASKTSSSASLSSSSGSRSSESIYRPCNTLPFMDCFDGTLDAAWSLKLGSRIFIEGDSPEEHCLLPGSCQRNWTEYQSSSSLRSLSSSSLSSASFWHLNKYTQTYRYGIPTARSSSSSCVKDQDLLLRLNDGSRRNVLVWEDAGTGCPEPYSYDRWVRTHLRLTNNAFNQNGGVILNYHTVDPITNPHIEYWTVHLNRNSNAVELLRYNGTAFILENSVTPSTPFTLTDWYEIRARGRAYVGSTSIISVHVRCVTTPAWPTISFNFITSNWKEPDGYFGIHTNRAVCDFSFWELIDA